METKPIFDQNFFRECFEINREKGFHVDEDTTSKRQRLLMMVIGEASEAVESIRTGKYANRKAFEQGERDDSFAFKFHKHIKDSFEDELADIVLRLCDYAGYLGLH